MVSPCFALQVLYTSINNILRGSIIRFDAAHAEMVILIIQNVENIESSFFYVSSVSVCLLFAWHGGTLHALCMAVL